MLPLLSQRKNLILLKRAHGRWEGVNSNQAITRVQRAGCFPNKTSNQLSSHEDPHPYLPRAATAPMELLSTERLVLLKKVSSVIFAKKVSRGELGPSLTRTIVWGRGEQQQQFSMSKVNPYPAENTFFSSH